MHIHLQGKTGPIGGVNEAMSGGVWDTEETPRGETDTGDVDDDGETWAEARTDRETTRGRRRQGETATRGRDQGSRSGRSRQTDDQRWTRPRRPRTKTEGRAGQARGRPEEGGELDRAQRTKGRPAGCHQRGTERPIRGTIGHHRVRRNARTAAIAPRYASTRQMLDG